MALNIPNTDLPGTSFLKGIDTGSTMFSRLMQPVLEREKQKQQAEQFAQELALKKQQEARMGANSGLNRQILEQNLLKLKHSNDPQWAMQQLQAKLDYIQNLGAKKQDTSQIGESFIPGVPRQKRQEERPIPKMEESTQDSYINPIGGGLNNPEQGSIAALLASNPKLLSQLEQFFPENQKGSYIPSIEGKFSPESQIPSVPEMQKESYLPSIPEYEETEQPMQSIQEQPQEPQGNNQLPGGIDMDEIKRALTYQALGLKVPTNGIYKEPPQIKRMNDLRSKMLEAEYKHNLKLAEEQQKNELKNQQTRQKVIDQASNDLPHLEETLRSLKIMQKIAEDPKNDDLFGHWIEGHDTAAARAKNPNAGIWQVYGLDPIVAAEMKMSARGNQLALKSALQNKANFAETRPVAAAKLKGSIDKVTRQIQEMRKLTGGGNSSSVIVIDPSGKRFETTAENAAHLPEGWKRG